jgi:3',5'-cyclic AMP phosphodiesterase CpdA
VKLFAVSDLHVSSAANRALIHALDPHSHDCLILAGDIGETPEELDWTLRVLRPKFRQLFWVPGNHDLWVVPHGSAASAGDQRYAELVELCRSYDVLTPEDPYQVWPGGNRDTVIVPLFLLYDYSFHDPGITKDGALRAAHEAGIVCMDEHLLHAAPHPSREVWCQARLASTVPRLDAIPLHYKTILVSHFPLRRDLVYLPRITPFELWCGTVRTEDWHLRYRARAVVYGHLHAPGTKSRDGVRFEEVSLGYVREWRRRGWSRLPLRQILPPP